MRVAVIGGGVGGLALGACLHQAGVDALVYERVPVFQRVGLGLLLLPNGMQALDAIGCGHRARELARPLDLAILRRPDAGFVKSMQLDHHLGIVRADLLELLADSVPREAMRFGRRLIGVEQDADGVTLSFEGGAAERADYVVGADGVHSSVRRSLHPNWRPAECRIRELVSVCHAPDLAAVLDRTFLKILDPGGGLAVGIVPSEQGRIIWFIQYDGQRFVDIPTTADGKKRFAERLVGHWQEPIGELVERTRWTSSYVWRTVAPSAPAPLHTGRVALIGDAAHPLPTLTSQGANTALADAVCLGGHLIDAFAQGTDPLDAMARYDRERRPRLEEILRGGEVLVADFLDPRQETSRPIPLVH